MQRTGKVLLNIGWLAVPLVALLGLVIPWNLAVLVAVVGVLGLAGAWYLVAAPLGVHLLGAGPIPETVQWAEFRRIITRDANFLGLANPPALYYLEAPVANAYALGRPGCSAVVLTVPMLERLDVDQLRAVVGHEMSHIATHDHFFVILNAVSMRLTQLLSLAVRVVALLVALVVALALGLFATFIPGLADDVADMGVTVGNVVQRSTKWFLNGAYAVLMALSRDAEFRADEAGARVAGQLPMASALVEIDEANQECAVQGFLDLRYRSHPPTADRLHMLRALAKSV